MNRDYQKLNQAQEVSETDPFTVDRYKQFFRHFPKRVNVVLDVGCNTGRGGKILKELDRHLKIIGLDCLDSRLERIPLDIYEQKICSYSTDISLADGSVDVILAGEFIEHLYTDDVVKTLTEFYRLLKPEGRLLLTTPNPNYIRLKLTGKTVLGGAHVSQHYPSELKRQLAQIGFVNITILGSGKMSPLLGENFPFLTMYGSYLVVADRN
jgi:ubiquinone/menaquinone biosynthesis C-methylase UbiE